MKSENNPSHTVSGVPHTPLIQYFHQLYDLSVEFIIIWEDLPDFSVIAARRKCGSVVIHG